MENNLIFRKIRKTNFQGIVNLLGLSIGIASVIIISFYVNEEYSYDTFNKNFEDIYIINSHPRLGDNTFHWHTTPGVMGDFLPMEVPEIKHMMRVRLQGGQSTFKNGALFFYEDKYAKVDSNFFQFFTYPLVYGDPSECLVSKDNVVINETLAKKYFGNINPVGKTIIRNGSDPMRVSGVMRNFPDNSHIQLDAVSALPSNVNSNWGNYGYLTYIIPHEGVDSVMLNSKVRWFNRSHNSSQGNVPCSVQKLEDIHLAFDVESDGWIKKGSPKIMLMLILVASFIFILSCVNYINLATAKYEKRSKEIGIKKTLGITHVQLLKQFLLENAGFIVFSIIIALVMANAVLPLVNETLDMGIRIKYNHYLIYLILSSIFVISVVLAGLYPSIYLASLKPLRVMQRQSSKKHTSLSFRKALVVTQFTVSICLITSSLLILNQFKYIRSKNLGFENNNIVSCYAEFGEQTQLSSVKQELMKSPYIESVSFTSNRFGDAGWSNGHNWPGKEYGNNFLMGIKLVDYDYFKTMGMECLKGRLFSKDHGTDKQSFVISEFTSKLMGVDDPIGLRLRHNNFEGDIIGVLSDVHYQSLHEHIRPYVYYPMDSEFFHQGFNTLLIKMAPYGLDHVKEVLQKMWVDENITVPFNMRYLDETINSYYEYDKQIFSFIKAATAISILLSCIGLFGLVMYVNERKFKEIGIRKVNGATWHVIYVLLTQYFISSIIIALVVANVLSYFFMNKMLQFYEYHEKLQWQQFMLGGAIAVFITLAVITFHSYKSSRMDPVRSLKYE